MSETISVIIPVYGVEPYLRRCLDSVLAQTWRALEIILVDDGSPDGCPAICDEYAAADPRVRVIHKKNGGLSRATGEWVGFVDSDDWLDPEMFERLYDAARRGEADMAVCNYCTVDDRAAERKIGGVEEELLLGRDDALRLLLRDKSFQNYVWNKLFRTEHWRDIRFPVGRAFEDIDTTWRLVDRRVALVPFVGYYYLVRGSGIVQSQSIKNEIDCVEQGLARYEALRDRYPECARLMEDNILKTINKVWGLAWVNRDAVGSDYQPRMERFAAFARQHLQGYTPDEPLGITGRLTLRLLPYPRRWAYRLAHALHSVYLWKHPLPNAP